MEVINFKTAKYEQVFFNFGIPQLARRLHTSLSSAHTLAVATFPEVLGSILWQHHPVHVYSEVCSTESDECACRTAA